MTHLPILCRIGGRPAAFRRPFIALALLLVVVGVTGCGDNYPQSTVSPNTDFADLIHSLYISVFWWTMFILAVVWVAMAYVVVRFRAKPGAPLPKQVHGHLGLEIGWTIGPALIVVAIAIPTIQTTFATQRPLSDDALEVHVTGHRYWWDFYYPEYNVRTANELHLPVGRAITLRLHSNDIIHSFWVPRLGGKRDLNPLVRVREGREMKYNYLFFTIHEPGVFMGQCAEFCGEAHAWMGMRVMAHTQEDFLGWVTSMETEPATLRPPQTPQAAAPAPPGGAVSAAAIQEPETQESPPPVPAEDPLISEGRRVFYEVSYCTLCHVAQGPGAPGTVPLGPNLTRFGERTTLGAGYLENNLENLIHWIRDPQEIKPGVVMPGVNRVAQGARGVQYPATDLTDDQVEAVAAYLLSLK